MSRLGFGHLYTTVVFLYPVLLSYFRVNYLITLGIALGLWCGNFLLNKASEKQDTSRSNDKYPLIYLNSTPGSHFVERVRWSLQYMSIPFEEEVDAGIIMAVVNGRTVPSLSIPGWRVTLGNSADIVRYLSAQTALKPQSVSIDDWRSFWDPYRTSLVPPIDDLNGEWIEMDAVAIEIMIHDVGYSVQKVVFGSPFASQNVGFAQTMWGCHLSGRVIPWYQRYTVWCIACLLLPMLKQVMQATPEAVQRSKEYLIRTSEWISAIRKGNESKGIPARKFILSDDHPTFVDFAYASLIGILFVEPDLWAAGKFDGIPQGSDTLRNADDFQELVSKLRSSEAGQFVVDLYRDYRKTDINGTAIINA